MRKSIHEINQIPPDFEDPGAKEYTPLPDEFNRDETKAEPPKKKPSSVRKVMLYLASASVVTLGIITPVIRITQADEPPAVVEATEQPSPTVFLTPAPTPAPTPGRTEEPTPAPTATPAPTPEPTEEPTPAPTATPRMTGQIHITVYSEVFDRDVAMRGDNEYPSKVLLDETLPAETFTEYELPPLPEQDGYRALGYVLLKSGGSAYLNGLLTDEEAEPAPIGTVALGNTLTADDLEIVPKDVEDVYNAEIHVVWLMGESPYHLEFYDGDALFGEYYVGFPIESEQLIYLAPFPEPVREGKTFAGWQNVDGFPVDAVTFFDFFEKAQNAKTVSDRDLSKPMPCRVYACWSDGSGGAPEPTPTPRPVYYTVTLIDPCGFSESSAGGGSRQVEKGKTVTIYVHLVDYSDDRTARFIVLDTKTGEQISTKSVRNYKAVEMSDGYMIYFKTTITVNGNITVDFPW